MSAMRLLRSDRVSVSICANAVLRPLPTEKIHEISRSNNSIVRFFIADGSRASP
jgi:hypothetical protein